MPSIFSLDVFEPLQNQVGDSFVAHFKSSFESRYPAPYDLLVTVAVNQLFVKAFVTELTLTKKAVRAVREDVRLLAGNGRGR